MCQHFLASSVPRPASPAHLGTLSPRSRLSNAVVTLKAPLSAGTRTGLQAPDLG